MNTSDNRIAHSSSATQQVQISRHSLWIGLAAFGCAFLLEAGEVNLTYPLEVFLTGVIKDNTIIDSHLYKIKL